MALAHNPGSARWLPALVLVSAVLASGAAPAAAVPFAGPELVIDLLTLRPSRADLGGPFAVGDVAVFLAHGRPVRDTPSYLWRTDGSAAGTRSIHPGAEVRFLDVVVTGGPYLGLEALDPDTSIRSFWRTDGSEAGTVRLVDEVFVDGSAGYHPELGLLFFTAAPWTADGPLPELELEPWVSDGTATGTRLLANLLPDGGSQPIDYRAFGDAMYFLAPASAGGGSALWSSDGTAVGTRPAVLPAGTSFVALETVGSRLFLVARDPADRLSLWTSDGTAEGTVELTPLAPMAPRLYPRTFLELDDRFFFATDDGATGRELWVTDGTPGGTRVAFETCPGPCSGFDRLEGLRDDRLIIRSADRASGLEIRATDGTAAGTELVLDLCPGPCSSQVPAFHLIEGGHALFLRASPPDPGFQVWGTDFTGAGTVRISDFDSVGFGSTLAPVSAGGGYLLVGANDGHNGLWAVTLEGDPAPPLGPWLASPEVPGFSFQVRISTPSGSRLGAREEACIPETACVSGALPGRSEVFLRVVGPKPNGRLWPTIVKFTTSTVEVWIRQDATGEIRYYRLRGARPGFDELPGLFDRQGFVP